MRRRLQTYLSKPSPSDTYVSEGLAYMWDGAQGSGNKWTDTISGLQLNINGTQYTWGSDFINVNGADSPYTYLYTTHFSGHNFNGHTIQVVARWHKTAYDQWGRFLSLRYSTNSPCEILIDKTATTGIGRLRFEYYDGINPYRGDVMNADMTKTFTATSVLNKAARSWYGYFNNVKSSVAEGVNYAGPYPSNLVVGSNELGYTNCGVNADFFSVRIYNRPLSEDEIM